MKYGKLIVAEGSLAFQLQFLSLALSDDAPRTYLEYIYIESAEKEGELLGVSTDGRCLHIVEPFHEAAVKVYGLTTGYWEVFKSYKKGQVLIARLEDCETQSWNYPNWRKCVPTGDVEYSTTFNGFTFAKGNCSNHNGLAQFLHDFPEITALNLRYLQSLGTSWTWNVEWFGKNKPIRFVERNRSAVIMPMQIM